MSTTVFANNLRPQTLLWFGRLRQRFVLPAFGAEAALTGGLIHHHRSRNRHIQARHRAQHGDPQQKVAGAASQIVQTGTLAAQHEGKVAGKVEVRVDLRPTLIQADDPDVLPLHCLQRAHQIGYSGHADVLGCAGSGFCDRPRNRGGPPLRQHDPIDTGTVRRPQQGTQIVRIFYTIQGQKEAFRLRPGLNQILERKRLSLLQESDNAAMALRLRHARQLIAALLRNADAGSPAGLLQRPEACTAACKHRDMIDISPPRTHRLQHRVRTIQHFHRAQCIGGDAPGETSGNSAKKGVRVPKSCRWRVFRGKRHVLQTVKAILSLTNALAHQEIAARENDAIACGLKRQDPELLDRLIDTYQHRLMRYLIFLTGKREMAEDLFQETWMRVLLRGAQYNGKARFDTWMFTIARNLFIDLSRKRVPASLDELHDTGEDERPFEIAMEGPSPLEQFCSRESAAEVTEVLMNLHPVYREVLSLRFHEELSLEEISAVTRAPLSTVKSRLYRGLASLKPQIEQLRQERNDTTAAGHQG